MTDSSSPSGIGATGPRASGCPVCARRLTPDERFCPACGTALSSAASGRRCGSCGAPVAAAVRFCGACGVELDGTLGGMPDTREYAVADARGGCSVARLDDDGKAVSRFPLRVGETTVGREGADLEFAGDAFQSPLHAVLIVRNGAVSVRDLGSRNGTWVFITEPHRLIDGDRVLIGSQLLLYRRLGYPGPRPPEQDATRRMGSLLPSADIACLIQLRADGSERDVLHLSPGRTVMLGREGGAWNFPYDPSMSSTHAEVRSEDADFVIADLGSRNGVALEVRGEVPLPRDATLMIGDTLLRVEQP